MLDSFPIVETGGDLDSDGSFGESSSAEDVSPEEESELGVVSEDGLVEGDSVSCELLSELDHVLLDESFRDEGTEGSSHPDLEEGEEVGEELFLVPFGFFFGEGSKSGDVHTVGRKT